MSGRLTALKPKDVFRALKRAGFYFTTPPEVIIT
jgi:hypothetical protein